MNTSPTLKARQITPTAWWAALLAPVLLVNAVAFSGQYAWANANLPHLDIDLSNPHGPGGFNLTAAAFAAALESIAIYLQYEAHTALMAGDSSLKLRLGSYAVALLAGGLNYWHWANPDHSPTPAAVAFGALSALSPWLWAIRSRSMHREQLRAKGLVEERAVKFATARWMLYPRRTYRAFRLAVWVGETDPFAAIGLLDQAQASAVIADRQPVSDAVKEAPGAPEAPPVAPPVQSTSQGLDRKPQKIETPRPKTCPTREIARQILLAMDPLDLAKTSNAELGRKHGGSDNWWGQRRGEVLVELEKFNAEAQVL